jgi:hypothetical protein
MASSPATLVAIATALFVAIAIAHPPTLSPSPSPCRPHCCSPRTLVTIAIALATLASTIVIACHSCCHRNCPLRCLCLDLPATLVASRRHPSCRPTSVAAVAAAAGCQPWQWRRCWQRGNKVNEEHDNNMTTTQQPTQQPTRQPTRGGDN